MNKKILIVAPNWLGDAVLSLPAIDGSASLWPDSELTVLAHGGVAQMLAARQSAVRVLGYTRINGLRRLGNHLVLTRRLRRERFHLALLFPNSLSSAMRAWMAGVPERAGYATDGRSLLLTRRVRDRRKESGLHQADYYGWLIRSLGAVQVDCVPQLRLKPNIARMALSWFSDLNVGKDEILIGVHPGAAYGEAKRWFPERFAAVIQRLQRPGRRFFLFGGTGEEALADEICRGLSHSAINLVGRTTVAEVLALISQCDLFLSNDSGLMHVAAASGIPQVALFGSTDPLKTAPLNDLAVIIHPKQVTCTPCFKRSCPANLECMKAITVDEVCAAADRLLHATERKGICD